MFEKERYSVDSASLLESQPHHLSRPPFYRTLQVYAYDMESETLLRAQYRQQLDNIKTMERDMKNAKTEKATALRECEDYQNLLQLSQEKAATATNRIAAIQTQLRVAREHVSRLAPRCSAFSKLDVSLLHEIFRWCYNPDDFGKYNMNIHYFGYAMPSRSAMAAPFVLASVCKKWRTVAIKQSELWNFIFMSTTGSLQAAKVIARRSNRHNVGSTSIYINAAVVINDNTDIDGCLSTFKSFSSRVQSLDIVVEVADEERIKQILNILDDDLPSLRRLVISEPIQTQGAEVSDETDTVTIDLPNTRRLSYVGLFLGSHLAVTLRYTPTTGPMSKLRFLSLRVEFSPLLQLLSSCPCLEILHLLPNGDFDMDEELGRCPLNCLRELRLQDADAISWFIHASRFIDTPQLSHLEIVSSRTQGHPCFDASFFETRSNISTLGLYGAPNPISREAWTQLRRVQRLELSKGAPTTALSLLAAADSPLCPELQTVCILDDKLEVTAVEPLVQLIKNRNTAAAQPGSLVSRIRRVDLPPPWEHNRREILELSTLR